MQLRRLVPVALAVILAGCSFQVGSSDGSSETASSGGGASQGDSGTSEDGVEAGQSELDLGNALITVGDLPNGFSPADDLDDEGEEEALCEAGGQTVTVAAVDDAGTGFVDGNGTLVLHGIEQHEPGGPGRELEAMRQESAACDGEVIDGLPSSVEAMIFPQVGEDTAAFRITQQQNGVTLTFDIVAFQTGDLVSYVAVVGTCGCPPEFLIGLARLAEERAADLVGVPA